jgi:hypothetical protein
MQYYQKLPVSPENSQAEEPLEEFEEIQQRFPLRTLMRQTGLGIKLRFLLALTLVAVFPAIVLVLLLGDPSGQEQRASLAQALFLQTQAQANTLDQTIQTRQQSIANLANKSIFTQAAQQIDPGQTRASLLTLQQIDSSLIGLMEVQPDGHVISAGDSSNRLAGMELAQTKLVSDPEQLVSLVHAIARGAPGGTPLLHDDAHMHGGWLAFAFHISQGQGNLLLAVYSLQKLTQGSVAVANTVEGEVAVLLDQQGRLVASTGPLAHDQKAFGAVPQRLQTLPANVPSSTSIDNNPLTGRSDIAASAAVPTLHGHYLLFAPRDAPLTPSARLYFAGRNTPLLILGILVVVVLVATWVALPIVRPIRRATREIGFTTDDVRELAEDARRIARDHAVGTTILSGASKRLGTRRQAIIRDGASIASLCQVSQPAMQWLYQSAKSAQNQRVIEALQQIQQALSQIYQLGTSIATGLENDGTLKQLDGAMESAREISLQFDAAGKQLERGAEQLEEAARALL